MPPTAELYLCQQGHAVYRSDVVHDAMPVGTGGQKDDKAHRT
jgi:hypothetical protein